MNNNKKNSLFQIVLIGIAVSFFGLNGVCKETVKEKATGESGSEKKSVVSQEKTDSVSVSESVPEGNNAFAVDLYSKLKKEEGNLFLSPYSISTALAMTYAGAKGKTEKQMAKVLHFSLNQDQFHSSFSELQNQINSIQEKGEIKLTCANSLWLQKGYSFLLSFLDVTEKNYDAGFNYVSFAKPEKARKKINLWVEEKTEQKIQNLIKRGIVTPLTRLVLTNAIYFKGNWKTEFDTTKTRNAPFKLNKSDTVTVPFMYKKEDCDYMSDSMLQVLALPYKGNDLSMIILLPRAVDGISDLEQSLSVSTINKWCSNLNSQKVDVLLPKFTMVSSFELKKILIAMGMPLAFSKKADFSGMTKKKELRIDEVVHKAFVDVNEEGTEAAAATAVVMRKLSLPMPPEEFRADHPFIFLIRDNRSGSILFIGRLANPKSDA